MCQIVSKNINTPLKNWRPATKVSPRGRRGDCEYPILWSCCWYVDIISCLGGEATIRLVGSWACCLSVCSVYSRHYGFSYIVMFRQHAWITHSIEVMEMKMEQEENNYPSMLLLFCSCFALAPKDNMFKPLLILCVTNECCCSTPLNTPTVQSLGSASPGTWPFPHKHMVRYSREASSSLLLHWPEPYVGNYKSLSKQQHCARYIPISQKQKNKTWTAALSCPQWSSHHSLLSTLFVCEVAAVNRSRSI